MGLVAHVYDNKRIIAKHLIFKGYVGRPYIYCALGYDFSLFNYIIFYSKRNINCQL